MNQRVTVTAKILRAGDKEEVKPNLFKQDLCIADATATCRLTVWQEMIDSWSKKSAIRWKTSLFARSTG